MKILKYALALSLLTTCSISIANSYNFRVNAKGVSPEKSTVSELNQMLKDYSWTSSAYSESCIKGVAQIIPSEKNAINSMKNAFIVYISAYDFSYKRLYSSTSIYSYDLSYYPLPPGYRYMTLSEYNTGAYKGSLSFGDETGSECGKNRTQQIFLIGSYVYSGYQSPHYNILNGSGSPTTARGYVGINGFVIVEE